MYNLGMDITLKPEVSEQALASIKRFFLEELDRDLGDLKAGTVLQFFLRELAPSVYNQAVLDAQRYLQDRALDLEGTCHAEEFGYWTAGPSRGGRRR